MKFESYANKYGVGLFYIGIALLIFDIGWFWLDEMPRPIVLLCRYGQRLAIILLELRLLLLARKYPRYFIGCLIILSVLYISYRHSETKYLYLTGWAIAASRGSNYAIVLRIYLIAFLSILLAIPTFHYLGWTEDTVKHSMGLVGHSWGLYNPNRLGGFLVYLLMLIFLIKQNLSSRQILLICVSVALMVMLITMSVTATLLLLSFPLLLQLNWRYKMDVRWWMSLPIFCFALSLALAFYFGPSDEGSTFVSRFSIPYQFYMQDGVNWLGQVLSSYVNWEDSFATGKPAQYINNMYLGVILRQGILACVITMGYLSLLCYRIGRNGSAMLKAIALCTLLYGILQSYPLYIRFDYLLLALFCIENRNSLSSTSQ